MYGGGEDLESVVPQVQPLQVLTSEEQRFRESMELVPLTMQALQHVRCTYTIYKFDALFLPQAGCH